MKSRSGSNGLITFRTGALVDNYGGDIVFLFTLLRFLESLTTLILTTMITGLLVVLKMRHARMLLKSGMLTLKLSSFLKTRMSLILGSPLESSPSLLWDGPMLTLRT